MLVMASFHYLSAGPLVFEKKAPEMIVFQKAYTDAIQALDQFCNVLPAGLKTDCKNARYNLEEIEKKRQLIADDGRAKKMDLYPMRPIPLNTDDRGIVQTVKTFVDFSHNLNIDNFDAFIRNWTALTVGEKKDFLQSVYKAKGLAIIEPDEAFSKLPVLHYTDLSSFNAACEAMKFMQSMVNEIYYDSSEDTIPHIQYTFSSEGYSVDVSWRMFIPYQTRDTQYVFKLVYDGRR